MTKKKGMSKGINKTIGKLTGKDRSFFSKVITAVGFLLVTLMIVGCGNSSGQSEGKTDEPIKVGILQFAQVEALDSATEGVKEALEASGLSVTFDVQNAQGDTSNLQSISQKLARDNDILVGVATPAAQALATAEKEKPIFFTAVTDAESAGLVASNDQPGGNVTGTSDMSPLKEQVALLKSIFPDAKTVGILYNSSEANSKFLVDNATPLLEDAGLTVETGTITSTNDIQQVLSSLLNKSDVLFGITDNTVDSAMTLVGNLAKEQQKGFVGSAVPAVEANGLATFGMSYLELGKQTGRMIIRHLEDDEAVSSMPVESSENLELVVNDDYAKEIGIDPESIKAPE